MGTLIALLFVLGIMGMFSGHTFRRALGGAIGTIIGWVGGICVAIAMATMFWQSVIIVVVIVFAILAIAAAIVWRLTHPRYR